MTTGVLVLVACLIALFFVGWAFLSYTSTPKKPKALPGAHLEFGPLGPKFRLDLPGSGGVE